MIESVQLLLECAENHKLVISDGDRMKSSVRPTLCSLRLFRSRSTPYPVSITAAAVIECYWFFILVFDWTAVVSYNTDQKPGGIFLALQKDSEKELRRAKKAGRGTAAVSAMWRWMKTFVANIKTCSPMCQQTSPAEATSQEEIRTARVPSAVNTPCQVPAMTVLRQLHTWRSASMFAAHYI